MKVRIPFVKGNRCFSNANIRRFTVPSETVPPIYLRDDEIKFFRKVEDDRRKQFGLPTLVRHRDVYRKPLLPIDERNADDLKEMRSHLTTIVSLLDRISGEIAETPNTSILKQAGARWKYTTEIPKYPQKWNKDSLVSYLKALTEKNYQDPLLNSDVGVVAGMVKNLLRINNPDVLNCLTVEAFKRGIIYFVRKKNIRAARELFEDIAAAGLEPDVEIFNVLLFANRTIIKTKSKWINHPLTVTENLLSKMFALGIKANYETWNAVLITLQGGLGKGLLLEAMKKRGIPLSDKSYAIIIGDIVSLTGPKDAMMYLQSQDSHTVTAYAIAPIIRGLLSKKQDVLAWDYLQYATEKWGFTPTAETMNTYARFYAEETQRIDWILGIVGAMTEKWQIKPNELTYAYMLQCANKLPFTKKKYDLLESIYAHMVSVSGSIPAQALEYVRNAEKKDRYYQSVGVTTDRPLKFDRVMTESNMKLMRDAQKTLKWVFSGDSPAQDNIHYGAPTTHRSVMAKSLGVPRYQHNLQKPTFKHKDKRNRDWEKVREAENQSKAFTYADYTRKIEELGPYGALQEEITKRGVRDGEERLKSPSSKSSNDNHKRESKPEILSTRGLPLVEKRAWLSRFNTKNQWQNNL